MESHNILEVQSQIRENSDDLQKYLLELESWEKEMKKKEEDLKLLQPAPEEEIPPVRNLLYRSKKKSRHKKQKCVNGDSKAEVVENGDQMPEIFKAEGDEEAKEVSQSDELAETNSDHEEELEILRKKQIALLHKEKGNDFFKKGNYDSAINSYTTGIMLDPENPLLLANRAMAFLKKQQFQAAENDCSTSLSYDPTYTKAYLRRGTARKNLNKLSLAIEDFSKALELEPENKQAQSELKAITEVSDKSMENASSDKSLERTSKTEDVCIKEMNQPLLEIKSTKRTTEKLEISQSSNLWNIANDCIFPDSIPVPPSESSISKSDWGPEFEIETKAIDETLFVKKVQERMNSLKKSSSQPNPSSVMETVKVDIKIPLPPVPSTSFQFIADWNELSQDLELRYKYLKQFPPEKLPVIFKHYMEPMVFPTLLETLCTSFLENGDDIFDYMKYLPEIGRFTTTLMFLSQKEEKDLEKLLECVKSSQKPESEVDEVLNKYKT